MSADPSVIDFESHFKKQIAFNNLFVYAGTVLFLVLALAGIWMNTYAAPVLGVLAFVLFFWLSRHYQHPYRQKLRVLKEPFPENWKVYLDEHSFFYKELTESDKLLFHTRVLLLLAEKKITGIETTVEDETKLLVAASAIIPTFAFPYYEYPNVKEILLYANAFDENFQTETTSQNTTRILGMVGNRFLNNTLLLSKHDLLAGFRGKADQQNVGIHEFVHLIDKSDGAIDGIPQIFLNNRYAIPWMKAIQEEMDRIRKGKSDINPYGLTNEAEFFAVVSEYFFDNPAKFHKKHPQLYALLCTVYHQQTDKKELLKQISY